MYKKFEDIIQLSIRIDDSLKYLSYWNSQNIKSWCNLIGLGKVYWLFPSRMIKHSLLYIYNSLKYIIRKLFVLKPL